MKTVGQYLKQHRQEKKIKLVTLAKQTKIRPEFLKAIENDKFTDLPSAAFVKGFIRSFAKSVDANPDTALAIFRRDFDQDQAGKIVPRGLEKPLRIPSTLFTPKTTTLATSIIAVILVFSYIIYQAVSFSQAPNITITSPTSDTLETSQVTVRGSTDPDATLTINQKPISLSLDGEFETTLDLPPGQQTLVIISKSRNGKTRTVEKTITVEAE